MPEINGQARVRPVAVARARIVRADGRPDEVHYSYERVPWWQLRRRVKLARHLRFMRAEDKEADSAR